MVGGGLPRGEVDELFEPGTEAHLVVAVGSGGERPRHVGLGDRGGDRAHLGGKEVGDGGGVGGLQQRGDRFHRDTALTEIGQVVDRAELAGEGLEVARGAGAEPPVLVHRERDRARRSRVPRVRRAEAGRRRWSDAGLAPGRVDGHDTREVRVLGLDVGGRDQS